MNIDVKYLIILQYVYLRKNDAIKKHLQGKYEAAGYYSIVALYSCYDLS